MAKSFLKSKELKKMSNALLHNKYILYFIFIIAVGNLFHLVFTRDLASVAVFIASGLLTSFFSKNMIVILVVAMVVANVFRFGNGKEGFRSKEDEDNFENALEKFDKALEGFEDDDDDDEDEDEDKDDEDDDEDDNMDEEPFIGATKRHNHKNEEDGHTNKKIHSKNKHKSVHK